MLIRDRKSRMWHGRLTVGHAIFLRDELSIDVMAWLADWEVAKRDLSDPAIVANCVWALLRDDLQRAGITDRKFGKLISGYTHADLIDEIVDELKRFAAVPELLPGSAGTSSKTVTAEALWCFVWTCGVDPNNLTFGQCVALRDASMKQESAQTALLCCAAFNSHGGKTKPQDFDGTGYLKALARHSDRETMDSIHDLSKALGVPVKVRRLSDGE